MHAGDKNKQKEPLYTELFLILLVQFPCCGLIVLGISEGLFSLVRGAVGHSCIGSSRLDGAMR